MTNKLYLKMFSKNKSGALFESDVAVTADANEAVHQVFATLLKAGVPVNLSKLRVRLRRFVEDGPFADGIFIADRRNYGVLLYGPRELTVRDVDVFLCQTLDPIPYYFAYRDNAPEGLLHAPVLPEYPELPEPIDVHWPATMAPINN
jgi:hypothetical protein